jgi:hypothetical protein
VIGLYLDRFFDYGIADEVHELKSGETAQGNALGTLIAGAPAMSVYAEHRFMLSNRVIARSGTASAILSFT